MRALARRAPTSSRNASDASGAERALGWLGLVRVPPLWFLLFGVGAASLPFWRLPAGLARLPYPPPPEALYALFFLAAALLRVLILRSRVAALERRTRRTPRRQARLALPPPGLLEVGAGIGKGVAEAVMGNAVGAAWAGAALLLRAAAARGPEDQAVAARRAAERRRAVEQERRSAALCVVGVGVICACAAWWPLVAPRVPAAWAVALDLAQRRSWR